MKFKIILLLLLLLNLGYSQDTSLVKRDTMDYYDMSLEELLKLKAHGVPSELEELINSLISVSSKKAMNTRETPGIISLVTEEEIKNSGARDLIDVLRLIPGLDFGVDVEGVVGLGMRGNWSNEGKILLLIDGQEINETMYASIQLGNRYPVGLIKKIEIIRGPGSAIYGGYAEYGVINIVTKQAEDINGVFASATYGQMEKDYGRRNVSLAIGKKFKDFSFNVSGMLGEAQRSDQVYSDYSGQQFDMRGSSALNTSYLNVGAGYKKLSFRLILNDYNISMRDGYGNVIKSGHLHVHFEDLFSELKYVTKVREKWTISSRLNYKYQHPWENLGYQDTRPYHKSSTRTNGNITATYEQNRNFNIVFGAESYFDLAKDFTDSSFFINGKNSINYFNYAFFGQSHLKTRYANFVLGARFDNNSAFGSAFVPRVGITKKLNNFHYKVLFGRAFRAPSIENINFADSSGIKPEFTNVLEMELGYQLTRKSILSFNIFDISTTRPIVYYTSLDSMNNDFYTNFGSSGTQGIEAEYRYRSKWGYVNLNYAYYTAINKSRISFYQTNDPASLLAFANHKLNLSTQINLNKFFSFCATASYYGNRWLVSGIDSLGNSILDKSNPTLLLNGFLQFQMPEKGLNIGLGIYDILNQKFTFIQPYDGGHAPLPGPSREIILRLQYNFSFKKKDK